MLNVSKVTLEINSRFFEAIDTLKRQNKIGGLSGFAKKYYIVLGNLYTIKTNQKGAVKAEYLYYLVRDFDVSAEWLLLGTGEMFTQNNSKTE